MRKFHEPGIAVLFSVPQHMTYNASQVGELILQHHMYAVSLETVLTAEQ